ncbi:MAG: protein glxC [Planctomycetota bacterium]|nr:protein glxC [Planctomycetota bacterium]
MSIATPRPREATLPQVVTLNAAQLVVSDINRFLHHDVPAREIGTVNIEHPAGMHNLAVGLQVPVEVNILGPAGYYAGGMNKHAHITVQGNVERGVAENMMSGTVHVTGNASECAGASAHGGLLIIEGDAAGRCGISLKGGDIVVGGSVGHVAMFMAQAGRLVVCGDAGPGLGDSLYEAVIYVGGKIEGLGADAREEAMADTDRTMLAELLTKAGLIDVVRRGLAGFKKVTSARTLYHWNSANHESY